MNDFSNEQWLPVPGFERYQVSSMGRIVRVTSSGPKPLHGKIDRIGYQQVGLVSSPGKGQVWFLVHRLVAGLFLPKADAFNGAYMTVNHKNRVKSDNRAENLEFMTITDNHRHWRKESLIPPATA